MAFTFRLPDLGEGITEAEVIEWLVAEGDVVTEHQPLLRVETDKALVEIPAPAAGHVGPIACRPGDTVHVGEVLVSIFGTGESAARSKPTARPSTSVVGTLADDAVELPTPPPPAMRSATISRDVLATPAVRRLARDLGVRIEDVPGSGTGGRVTEADVRQHATEPTAAAAPLREDGRDGHVERVALRGIRRTIARRMKTAVAEAALATHMDEIDVTALVERLRARPAPDGSGSGFAWIVKATAQALRRHPRFNATLDGTHEEVLIKHDVHIGVAVDTPDGLMVPVIHHVDQARIAEIGAEIDRLATACRRRAIEITALRGGTFSVSNIGALGGMFATPIPNYPEVAILATGRITERLARAGDGAIVTRMVLPVSLSFDHRVLDGADAARFVNTLREILAAPDGLDH